MERRIGPFATWGDAEKIRKHLDKRDAKIARIRPNEGPIGVINHEKIEEPKA